MEIEAQERSDEPARKRLSCPSPRRVAVAGFTMSSVVLLAGTLIVLTGAHVQGSFRRAGAAFLPVGGAADVSHAWSKRPRLMTREEADEGLAPGVEESDSAEPPEVAHRGVVTDELRQRRPHYLDVPQRRTCGPARCKKNYYLECVVVGVAYVRDDGGALKEAPDDGAGSGCLEICLGVSEELLLRSAGEPVAKAGECESVALRYEGEPGSKYCRFFAAPPSPSVEEFNDFLGLEDDCFTEEGRRAAERKARSRQRPTAV